MRPANSPVVRRSPAGETGKCSVAYAIAATRSLAVWTTVPTWSRLRRTRRSASRRRPRSSRSRLVRAARTLASTASRVSFAAIVRLRRPVDFDGDFVTVVRVVPRVVARLRWVLGLRAVLLRFAGAFLVVGVVVVVS